LEEEVATLREEHDRTHQARVEQAHKKEARSLEDKKRREARAAGRAAAAGEDSKSEEMANPTFDAESPLADEKGEAKEKSDKQKANKQKAEKIMKNIREEYAEIKELGFKEDGRWKIAPR